MNKLQEAKPFDRHMREYALDICAGKGEFAVMIGRIFLVFSLAGLLGACTIQTSRSGIDQWDEYELYDAVEKVAVESLRQRQVASFSEQREYCGWVVYRNGEITSTEIVRGGFDRCELPNIPKGSRVLASFHNHGNHTPEYSSEFPSIIDIQGDFESELFGFVGTPGGRVWVVDPFEQTVSQVCGEGCIPIDPTYRASDYKYIPKIITREMIFG